MTAPAALTEDRVREIVREELDAAAQRRGEQFRANMGDAASQLERLRSSWRNAGMMPIANRVRTAGADTPSVGERPGPVEEAGPGHPQGGAQ